MQSRVLCIILALALPILAVAGIVYFASKKSDANIALSSGTLPPIGRKKNDNLVVSMVPVTIEEARKRANARLEEIKKMTQAQWDAEREKVAYRNPPAKLELAIARAQLRVDDLAKMTAAEWENEKNTLRERERRNSQLQAQKSQQAEQDKQAKVQQLIDSVKPK